MGVSQRALGAGTQYLFSLLHTPEEILNGDYDAADLYYGIIEYSEGSFCPLFNAAPDVFGALTRDIEKRIP